MWRIGGPTSVFIVPFHAWGSASGPPWRSTTPTRGYTVNQFWPARFAKVPITTPLDLTGFEPEYAPFTTPEGRTLTLDYVKRSVNGFVDLMFHHITTTQLPTFGQLMTDVARSKANVRTWGRWRSRALGSRQGH